jgi:hypothetical protein
MWALIAARVAAAIAARNGISSRFSSTSGPPVDACQRVMGVHRCVPVAGEVLSAGGDLGGLKAGDVGGRAPCGQVGVGAEGADPD